MKKLKTLGITIFILIATTNTYAKENENITAQEAKNITATNKETLTNKSEENKDVKILLLEMQNKIIKENQDRIISTVYLALGGIFTLAAVLAGFGWWSNFKIYDSDKKRLSEELKNNISEAHSKISIEVIKTGSDTERELNKKFSNQIERLTIEGSQLKSEISAANKKIETFEARIEQKNKNHQHESDYLKSEILKLRVECFNLEGHIWEMKDIPGNLLMTLVQGLETAYKAKKTWEIEYFPKKIEDIIQSKYIDENRSIHRSTLDIILREVDEISKNNSEAGKQIKESISKIKVID